MVTVNNMLGAASGTAEIEFKGLSTDEKPVGRFGGSVYKQGDESKVLGGVTVGVNSLFLELDTGDLYYYTGSEWNKVGSGNGSV